MDDGDEQQAPKPETDYPAETYIVRGMSGVGKSATLFVSEYVQRPQAIQEVAKANPSNIQEVAASQLAIINSYYESGLQQSQQSFKWALIWGGIGQSRRRERN